MRILLVWPQGFDADYVVPISLAYLKSNMISGHDVKIFDCSFSNVYARDDIFSDMLLEFKPDVVGVSSWSPMIHEALEVLKVVKEINDSIVTVIGGGHPSSYPENTMNNLQVDYLFRGESELSFPVFISELEKSAPDFSKVHGLMYRNRGDYIRNEMQREVGLDKIKIPDYDAILLDNYIDSGYRFNTKHKYNAPIWVTRGCPYRCGFCSAPLQNGKPVRAHSINYVKKWIMHLYFDKNIRLINIIDDNFTFHVKYAKEFCNEMISMKDDLGMSDLKFSTPNGIRAQRADYDLFKLMKRAGWENIVIAPETGSPDTLARMKKDLDLGVIEKRIKEIKQAGLKVHGFFIIGYPGDTIDDIKLTGKFIRKNRFNMVFINNFQPLPGTPIYDELVRDNEIEDGLLPKNYSNGERAYTSSSLKEFNFPRFVLFNYLYTMLIQPTNIIYMFTLVSPSMIIKKVILNLSAMFFRK